MNLIPSVVVGYEILDFECWMLDFGWKKFYHEGLEGNEEINPAE